MLDLKGKVLLLTGGAGDVGRAVAEAAGRLGANVVVVDRDPGGEQVAVSVRAAGAESLFVEADVSRTEDVQRYVAQAKQRFGAIDAFVNNAGILGPLGPLVDCDEAAFDRMLAVNVRGIFLGLKYVLPVMLAAGRGTVVNTSSTAAFTPSLNMGAYAATKAAILGLSGAAAGEAGPYGVRVNAVCPGAVDGGLYAQVRGAAGNNPQAFDAQVRNNIPTGRLTTPAEVANLVLFLASDLSGNVNGAQFIIDGGRSSVSGTFAKPGPRA